MRLLVDPAQSYRTTAYHDPLLWQELVAEAVRLCCEASACIHDESPQLLAASYTADVQTIIIALLYVLVYTGVGYVVVVPIGLTVWAKVQYA